MPTPPIAEATGEGRIIGGGKDRSSLNRHAMDGSIATSIALAAAAARVEALEAEVAQLKRVVEGVCLPLLIQVSDPHVRRRLHRRVERESRASRCWGTGASVRKQ